MSPPNKLNCVMTKILETILNKIDLSDIIIAILTIAGWIIAFIIMKNEVKKTHEKNLKLQDKLLARQVEYEAYKELQRTIRPFNESLIDFYTYLAILRSDIELTHKTTSPFVCPSCDWETVHTKLLELMELSGSKLRNFSFTYDFNQIVFPELRETTLKIGDAYLSFADNESDFFAFYPINCSPDNKIPLKEKQKEFNDKINSLTKKLIGIMAGLEDLSIELQNKVLGTVLDRSINKEELIKISINTLKRSGEDELRPYANQ